MSKSYMFMIVCCKWKTDIKDYNKSKFIYGIIDIKTCIVLSYEFYYVLLLVRGNSYLQRNNAIQE